MTYFVDGLEAGCEKKRGVRNGYKCFGLSKRWMMLLLTKMEKTEGEVGWGRTASSLLGMQVHMM